MALVALLAIQVYWILQTARMKEELFNEKANMVLSRTIEAIGNDETTCGQIQECVRADAMTGSTATLGKAETHTIDSLFNHFMRLYNFHIDYSFVVAKPEISASKGSGFIYNQRLDQVASLNGVELKLIFPDKKDYIMAEMGAPFIASVTLILVVLAMFWRTVLSLMKEKKIAEHTTDFLNNMTHEFKTPLTNIALAGKMMVKDSNLRQEEKVKHYSGIILEENEKLRLQVEQVLSMTALERGEIPLEKTELDFHQLILDCTKCMGLQIENGKGELKLDLEANKFLISGDKTHLTNALCNLIDNGLKYANGKPVLHIQTSNQGQNLILNFSDQGIGIGKGYEQKVFEKFFRIPTGDVHNVKGFGLGLAYVKKIVELHGGSIELESEKGKGSKFTIRIPHV